MSALFSLSATSTLSLPLLSLAPSIYPPPISLAPSVYLSPSITCTLYLYPLYLLHHLSTPSISCTLCLSIHLSLACSIYPLLSFAPSIYPLAPSIYLHFYLLHLLSIHPSISCTFYLSTPLSLAPSIYPPVYLLHLLSIHTSISCTFYLSSIHFYLSTLSVTYSHYPLLSRTLLISHQSTSQSWLSLSPTT